MKALVGFALLVGAASIAHAGPGWGAKECTIKEMKTWEVPSDACIEKFRTMVFEPGTKFECDGWTAWWATKQSMNGHSQELAEGKSALPAVFIGRSKCDGPSEVLCVMAVRKLSIPSITDAQPFPTVCTETKIGLSKTPEIVQACVRGNLDWQRPGTKRARPKVLDDISPPSPPERADNPANVPTSNDKINCTTCHTVPYVGSTEHLVYTLAVTDTTLPGAMMGRGGTGVFNNPDDGSWLNTTDDGTALIRMIARHNRAATRDPTKLVWKEVAAIPWFGKNIGRYNPGQGDPTRRSCGLGGSGCHIQGFPINNHANWTQADDNRNDPLQGGKQFMDKNYCEFVAAPAFARHDKAITYDQQFFRGAMRDLMNAETRKWQTEAQCKAWWTAVGCVIDVDKQKSVAEMCNKTIYPEMFK